MKKKEILKKLLKDKHITVNEFFVLSDKKNIFEILNKLKYNPNYLINE